MGVYPEFLEKMGYEYLEKPSDDYFLKKTATSFRQEKQIKGIVGEAFAYAFQDKNGGEFRNQIEYNKDENGQPTKKPFVNLSKDKIHFTLEIPSSDGKGKGMKKEFQVAGRLKENARKAYQSFNGIFLDLNTIKEMEKLSRKPGSGRKPNKGYNQVIVMVKEIDNVEAVEKQIKEDGFETNSLVEMRKSLQKNRQQQMQMLYSTSLLALFVASISIMNTMIMSISERTKEIGVMKVIGCLVSDIKRLFLLESGVIGFIGGLFGIGLSYLLSFLLNHFGSNLIPNATGLFLENTNSGPVSILPIPFALAGLLFATIVGIIAGYLPANRAVKISALEAMKAG